MGFRQGSYATVWSVEPKSDTNTKIRISISRKNKQSGEYEQDFSGFVSCVGSVAAKNAARLKEKDRIKLGDIDVTTRYDADKKITYTNYTCFSFDMADSTPTHSTPVEEIVEEGAIDEDSLPF